MKAQASVATSWRKYKKSQCQIIILQRNTTRCYGKVCFFPFCVAYSIVSHYGTIGFIYLFIQVRERSSACYSVSCRKPHIAGIADVIFAWQKSSKPSQLVNYLQVTIKDIFITANDEISRIEVTWSLTFYYFPDPWIFN